ncbi:MAG: RNA polymerase subunit AC19 [Heterodermia speciosa]|uniref:DNA-directed RNA polymerases I and III subunit RPAC2 n=1 Tax=Heterodermia speciosa TaxID=116794 RepID=A0A8H3IFE1_9LECA|nr:MAG: RNA polymerase subunit AC19 [Heterodermia speciosa]
MATQVPGTQDETMPDAPGNENADGQDEDTIIGREDLVVRVLPGASDTAASFEIEHEDHTLGNSLRYMIMKNPEVELCGYSIPHPAEDKMNLRIQTYEGTTVYEALEKGLDDLKDLCDVVLEKFEAARDDYNERQL